MPIDELPRALWILLGIQTGLLVLLWLGQIAQGARLRRIERRLARDPATESRQARSEVREGKQLFEKWLSEDPERRDLPKKEQFAGFRKWRAEQGMNWDPERTTD